MTYLVAAIAATAVALLTATLFDTGPVRSTGSDLDGSSSTGSRRRLPIPSMRRTPHVVRPSALAAWADDLARALRHGSTLHAALGETVPTDAVVEAHSASLRHWLERGATVADACDEWADELTGVTRDGPVRNPPLGAARGGDRIELLATMSTMLAATATLGGPAAAPLDRFAVTMRQRASDDLERSAQSAQAKMSAKVLTSVPIAVLVLLLVTDADVRAVTTTAAGAAVVALGLGLNTIGAVWMRRIAGTGSAPS